MTTTDIYLAFCAGVWVGIAGLLAFVWALTFGQRRKNRRP